MVTAFAILAMFLCTLPWNIKCIFSSPVEPSTAEIWLIMSSMVAAPIKLINDARKRRDRALKEVAAWKWGLFHWFFNCDISCIAPACWEVDGSLNVLIVVLIISTLAGTCVTWYQELHLYTHQQSCNHVLHSLHIIGNSSNLFHMC